MKSTSQSVPSQRIEFWASFLALSSLTIFLLLQLFQPVPSSSMLPGIVAATSDRVSSGGPYYESPEGMCAPNHPYTPGILMVVHFISRATGLDPMIVCRLHGIFFLMLLSAMIVITSVQLGVRLPFAIAALAMASWVLEPNSAYQGGFTVTPDFVLLICAFGIVLSTKSFERHSVAWALFVAVLLLISFLYKTQASALYVGVFCFVMLRAGVSLSRKIWMVIIFVISGLAVITLLFSMSNCWNSCVVAMRHHPLSIHQLRTHGATSFRFLWPFFVFPFILLGHILKKPLSYARFWNGVRAMPAPILMLLCVLPFYAGIQLMAMMKYGGNSYTVEFVTILALPLVILSAYKCLRHHLACIVVFSAIAFLGFIDSSAKTVRSISTWSRRMESERTYLATNFPNAKVLYYSSEYYLLHRNTLQPITDMVTVWFYAIGGFPTEQAFEAVKTQYYDLVISNENALMEWATPAYIEYKKLIHDYYVPIEDENTPEGIKGRLLKRRLKPLRD